MHYILERYYTSLTKANDRKYFNEIIKHYPKIAPRYYHFIKEWIDGHKRSDNVKRQMHNINDTIYEYMFTHMGFLWHSHGFNIGDTFYTNRPNKTHTIAEFIDRKDGVFVIDNEYYKQPTLRYAIMIETISHQPRPQGESHFAKQTKKRGVIDDINMIEITSDVEMFLSYYANNEYNFDPIYQRELVWTDQQKEAFIKAILIGDTEVRPIFINIPYHYRNNGPSLEVLDGKQRLNSIISFVRDEFSVDDLYFSDLNDEDVNRLYNTPFIYTLIKYYSDKGHDMLSTKQKVELFLQINDYGQKVSDEHLSKIKSEYLDTENKQPT